MEQGGMNGLWQVTPKMEQGVGAADVLSLIGS